MRPENLEARFHAAVQQFWTARAAQRQKQVEGGKIDAGTRGAVTGGAQMGALEALVADLLEEAGLDRLHIRTRTALELPGYFRPEKKWDLLVVADGKLVTAMEFKSPDSDGYIADDKSAINKCTVCHRSIPGDPFPHRIDDLPPCLMCL